MEARCDYCGTEQTLVFCKSDSAKLCFNCDVFIHSANPLSLKHTRSFLCNKCFLQPALIHCLNEKISLCQTCYWTTSNCSSLGHKFQTLSSYSGCTSPKTWSSILEPSVLNLDFAFDKIEEFEEHSSFISMESNLPNIIEKGCSGLDLCEEINLDDAPLDFNASDDIIGCSSLDHIKCYNEDSFKEEKSIGLNSMFLPNLSGNVVQSLSLSMSNITGESSMTDFTDCGISPIVLIGDSPWESNVEVSYNPKSRDEAKKRYNQKKSKRTFGKQIRYASRKARADTRKRVKGRFVKS